MIRVLVEHQENQHGKSKVGSKIDTTSTTSDPPNKVIEQLNIENYNLYKRITEYRRCNEEL